MSWLKIKYLCALSSFEVSVFHLLDSWYGCRISIYAGDVTLRNLQLKPDALSDLELPVEVQAGILGSLTLKVPWKNLGGAPVVVAIDQLYLLVRPNKKSETRGEHAAKGSQEMANIDMETFEKRYQNAKLSRVEAKENAWVKGLERMKKGNTEGKNKGFLRGLIDTIVGNLQFSITNIHLRYEDCVTRPGHTFVCGFTLQNLSAFTVDDSGKKAFISSDRMKILRKSIRLEKISLYFDCDVPQWEPMEDWHDMENETWQEWFQPDIGGHDSKWVQKGHRSYVLRPVDGRAMYTRRGKNCDPEKEAATELEVSLDDISVSLSRDQYVNYSLLLAEISKYTARFPHLSYRPRYRPDTREHAIGWWRYVYMAVRQNQENRLPSWERFNTFLSLRSQYVANYKDILRMKEWKRRKDIQIPTELQKRYRQSTAYLINIEVELPECTILAFRRVSHYEYNKEREEEEEVAKREQKQNQGWLGWLMGAQATKPLTSSVAQSSLEQKANLSQDEYDKVLSVLESQEESLKLKFETPLTILNKFTLHVDSASAILVDISDDKELLKGSLSNIKANYITYPSTVCVSVDLGSMGVDSKDGTFVQTGQGNNPGMKRRGEILRLLKLLPYLELI